MRFIIWSFVLCVSAWGAAPEILPLDTNAQFGGTSDLQLDVEDPEESIWMSKTPLNFGLDIQYGKAGYSNYQVSPGAMASGQGSLLSLNFEWIALQNVGKLGFGLGVGAFFQSNIPVDTASASLVAFPLDVSMYYRADYWDDRILVPYARIGREWTWLRQQSATGLSESSNQHLGWSYGVGLQVLLDPIDFRSSHDLEKATGINNTYLIVEYVHTQSDQGQAIDLTRSLYRAALRFEM